MKETQHLSSQFDEDLSRLRTRALQMGGLVETQVAGVLEAYSTGKTQKILSLIEADRRINELETLIDDDCAHTIAKRQPAASDLRLVLGIIRMVTDLERAGDEAKKIAHLVSRIYEHSYSPSQFGGGVRYMAERALKMIRDTLDAFARLDTVLAEQVIRADADVDSDFKSIMRELITHMMEDPRTITIAMDILWIARSIERIGDHAKNIAEHVIFVAEGQDVRHFDWSGPRKS